MQTPKARFSLISAALLTMAHQGAQAQLTISGAMDLSVEAINDGTAKRMQMGSGTVTSSRIVFAGREDLGDGLGAFFRLDMGVRADSGEMLPGQNSTFGRTSIVGLDDRRWGQLALGRTGTPLTPMLNQTDFGRIGYWGNNSSISQNLVARRSNGMFYASPSLGGLTVRAVYAFGEATTPAPKDAGNFGGLGLYYAKGPLSLAGGYQVSRERTATGTDQNVANQTEQGYGGKYDFGWVAVNAGWYKIHQVTPQALRDPAIPSNNTSSYWLGAVFPVGKSGTLGLQAGQTWGDFKAAGLPEPKGTTWAAYYAYSRSKRTSLYANYARVDNNAGSRLSLISAAYYARIIPRVNGADPSALAVGMVHSF